LLYFEILLNTIYKIKYPHQSSGFFLLHQIRWLLRPWALLNVSRPFEASNSFLFSHRPSHHGLGQWSVLTDLGTSFRLFFALTCLGRFGSFLLQETRCMFRRWKRWPFLLHQALGHFSPFGAVVTAFLEVGDGPGLFSDLSPFFSFLSFCLTGTFLVWSNFTMSPYQSFRVYIFFLLGVRAAKRDSGG